MGIFTKFAEIDTINRIMVENNLNVIYFNNVSYCIPPNKSVDILKIYYKDFHYYILMEQDGKEIIKTLRQLSLLELSMVYLKLQQMEREFKTE